MPDRCRHCKPPPPALMCFFRRRYTVNTCGDLGFTSTWGNYVKLFVMRKLPLLFIWWLIYAYHCGLMGIYSTSSVDLWVFILPPVWTYGYLFYTHCGLMDIYCTPIVNLWVFIEPRCALIDIYSAPSVDLWVFILSPVWTHRYLFCLQCGLRSIYAAPGLCSNILCCSVAYTVPIWILHSSTWLQIFLCILHSL